MLRAKVSLRIIGELDPKSISQELGIAPSYTHRKGDNDRLGEIITSDIWVLSTPYGRSESIEKHFEWLSEQFKDKYEALRKIKSQAKIGVFCGITFTDQSGFSLTPKSLSFFCDLQINLEVSLIGA